MAATIRDIVSAHPETRTHVLRAGGRRKHNTDEEEESLGYTGRCKSSRRPPCKKGYEKYARPTGEEDDLEMCCMRLAIRGEERFQRVQLLRQKEAELSTKLEGYEALMEDQIFDEPISIIKPNGKKAEYTFTEETLRLKILSVKAKRDRVMTLLGKSMPFEMNKDDIEKFAEQMKSLRRPEERTESSLRKIAVEIWSMFTWKNAKRFIGFLAKVALVVAGLWLCCAGGSVSDMRETLSGTKFGSAAGYAMSGFGKLAGWASSKLGAKFDLNGTMRVIFDVLIVPRALLKHGIAGRERERLAADFEERSGIMKTNSYYNMDKQHREEITIKIDPHHNLSMSNRNKLYRRHGDIFFNRDAQDYAEKKVQSIEKTLDTTQRVVGCLMVIRLAFHWFFSPSPTAEVDELTEEERKDKELEDEASDLSAELRWKSSSNYRLHAGANHGNDDDLIDISA